MHESVTSHSAERPFQLLADPCCVQRGCNTLSYFAVFARVCGDKGRHCFFFFSKISRTSVSPPSHITFDTVSENAALACAVDGIPLSDRVFFLILSESDE